MNAFAIANMVANAGTLVDDPRSKDKQRDLLGIGKLRESFVIGERESDSRTRRNQRLRKALPRTTMRTSAARRLTYEEGKRWGNRLKLP